MSFVKFGIGKIRDVLGKKKGDMEKLGRILEDKKDAVEKKEEGNQQDQRTDS